MIGRSDFQEADMAHAQTSVSWRRISLAALFAALTVAAFTMYPRAATREAPMAVVSVDCTGSPSPGEFTTIPDALASLDPSVGNTIFVEGDCSGQGVLVQNFVGLTIRAGAPGATISEPNGCGSSGPTRSVMHIVNSRGVVIDGMTLRGGSIGLDLTDSYGINLRNTTVENARNSGIASGEGSQVTLQGRNAGVPTPNVVQHNCGVGVFADATSAAGVNGVALIQNNGTGVVTDSGRVNLGTAPPDEVRIQNNSGFGIHMIGGARVTANRQTIVQNNNAGGVWAAAGAILDAGGGIQVLGNGSHGIHAQLNSTVVFGSIMNPGSPTNVTISGNTGEGLRLQFAAIAQSFQGVSMSGNGTNDASCDGSSWLFGNITGIAKLDCKNTDQRNK
jgi:hypothetical protein